MIATGPGSNPTSGLAALEREMPGTKRVERAVSPSERLPRSRTGITRPEGWRALSVRLAGLYGYAPACFWLVFICG